jgi:hypothetical protein
MFDKDFFLKKNLWKIYYQNGKESLFDLINFDRFNSNNNKKFNELVVFFKDAKKPIFPVLAKDLMEKFQLKEGKNLGLKIKEIEEKWIGNEFKISDKEIFKIIKN